MLLKDYPAGGGYQAVVYYLQLAVKEGQFTRYDFGAIENFKKYGQVTPPEIPIDKFPVPTGLFVGTLDELATLAGG